MTTELDQAIARHADRAFDLLADLVAAPSVVGDEQAALDVFAAELADLGLDVEKLPFPAGQPDDVCAGVSQSIPAGDERFQVVGRTPGVGPMSLLLNGHIDVVPAETPQLWTSPPFTPVRRSGRMFGRGTGDMKGGFAIGALALRALRDIEPDLFCRNRLAFLAVIEEECTGNGALLAAAQHAVLAEAVVLLEPTDLGLMVGGVGVLWVDVEVRGSAAHAESAHLSVNPVDLGMRLVEGLRRWCATLAQLEPDDGLAEVASPYNLNLGAVRAGDWRSSVPATATFGLRVGYPRGWSAARAETEVRAAVDTIVDGDPDFPCRARVTSCGLRAEGYRLETDHALVAAMTAAHVEAHGYPPRTFAMGSTTDARTYLNDFGVPALCFGAVAHDIHGVDESVELESIVDGARTLARFVRTWFRDRAVTS